VPVNAALRYRAAFVTDYTFPVITFKSTFLFKHLGFKDVLHNQYVLFFLEIWAFKE